MKKVLIITSIIILAFIALMGILVATNPEARDSAQRGYERGMEERE